MNSKVAGWQNAAVELGKLAQSHSIDKSEILSGLFDTLVDPGYKTYPELIDILSSLTNSETLNRLISALECPDHYTKDRYFRNRIAMVLAGCSPEVIPSHFSDLFRLLKRVYIQQLFWVIPTLQSQCKFYNYDLTQLTLPEDHPPSTTPPTTQMIFNGPVTGAAGFVQGDINIHSANTSETREKT